MKLRNTAAAGHRHNGLAPPPLPARGQPETDFTAEGSPPPGQVGTERPALPDLGGAALPAIAGEDGER